MADGVARVAAGFKAAGGPMAAADAIENRALTTLSAPGLQSLTRLR